MIERRWEGELVAILASGPSLNQSDINLLKGKARVIAVNDSYRLCPWADMLYAADRNWWHYHNYVTEFKGERWTQQQGHQAWKQEAINAGIHVITSKHKSGLSSDPELIHTGMNSAYQALNIAVLMGASRVLLLGLDCSSLDGKTHWFGEHTGKLKRKSPYERFAKEFEKACPDLDRAGVEVINCSERSAVACFRKASVIGFTTNRRQ